MVFFSIWSFESYGRKDQKSPNGMLINWHVKLLHCHVDVFVVKDGHFCHRIILVLVIGGLGIL